MTGLVLLILFMSGFLLYHFFTVDTVIVDGNVHYSDEEIQEMVLGGRL